MKSQIIILIVIAAMFISTDIFAQNIDPSNDGSKYAYGENVGWFNFKPTQGSGVTLRAGKVSGYAWQENIGWINLSPASYGGVTYDSGWNLSGYAWGENVGWIKFNPNYGGVTIDEAGNFSGWAWGENIGWIHFRSTAPVSYGVSACVVGFDDLYHFSQQWLMNGILSADLDHSTHVDFVDYSIFASDWLDFCLDNWQLK